MTSTTKKTLQLVSAAAVLVLVVVVWHVTHEPPDPLVGTTQNIADFDQFQQDLATRVQKEFGGSTSDFSAIVATASYPVGTLLRASGSVPANLDDCVPAVLPKPFAAQRMFPSYTLSKDTALAANLGSHALEGLDNAGVNLQQSQKIEYNIADTQILIMDDKSVEQVTSQGNCGKYLAAHPGMRLIRGSVTGKITFTVKVENPASVKAQLAKFGGFSISDNPGSSTVSVADQENEPIVELLSEFTAAPVASATPLPKQVEALRPAARPPAQVAAERAGPHVFVQMDAQDSVANGAKVVQMIRSAMPEANVESNVEKIDSRKVPDTAQVRYFNQSDAALANRCAAVLSQTYPNARAVRSGLTAAKGQLEVWMPKVKPGPGQRVP